VLCIIQSRGIQREIETVDFCLESIMKRIKMSEINNSAAITGGINDIFAERGLKVKCIVKKEPC